MEKLLVLAAVLGVLSAVSTDARTHKTGVVCSRSAESCKEQIQRHDFSPCERYVTQRSALQHLMLKRLGYSEQGGQIEQCCRQLGELDDEECKCEALEDVSRRLQEQWELEGEQLEQMKRRVSQLASRCGVGSECRPRGRWNERREECREQIQREDLGMCERYVAQGGGSENAKRCCGQLERLDNRCQGEAIRQIIQEQQQGKQREEIHKVQSRAKQLREKCDISE